EEALARKDLEAARAAAEQAGSLYPHDPVVHLLLGRAHLAAGRAAEAVDELRRGLTLDPLLAAGHRYLGYALAAIGRFAEAVEQWSRWERLAARSETELAQQGEVRGAKTAAQARPATWARSRGSPSSISRSATWRRRSLTWRRRSAWRRTTSRSSRRSRWSGASPWAARRPGRPGTPRPCGRTRPRPPPCPRSRWR